MLKLGSIRRYKEKSQHIFYGLLPFCTLLASTSEMGINFLMFNLRPTISYMDYLPYVHS